MTKTSVNDLDEIVRLSYLYDFYGPLLKEKQRQIFENYVLDDYSLSEIAGEYGMTRQGVHDIVKRSSEKLEEYESKLKLYRRFRSARERLEKVEELVGDENLQNAEKIRSLTHEVYEMLKKRFDRR